MATGKNSNDVFEDEVKDKKTDFIKKAGAFAHEAGEELKKDHNDKAIVMIASDGSEDEDADQIVVAAIGTGKQLTKLAGILLNHEVMGEHFKLAILRGMLSGMAGDEE